VWDIRLSRSIFMAQRDTQAADSGPLPRAEVGANIASLEP
jgi:hypothetical protein